MPNIVIIGGGPAGLSAAIYAVRAGMQATVLYKDGGALAKTDKIENYFGFIEPVSGAELLERGQKQAERLGAVLRQTEVTGIEYAAQGFTVKTADGVFDADAVILATGSPRAVPKIEGVAAFEGRGVSYCAICDAFFYRGKDVAVLGQGEYALEEARVLLPVAQSVTLLTDGSEAPADLPDGLRYLRTGLLLGTCKKERFEPSQALALALSANSYPDTLDLLADDPRILRYLKGETIEHTGDEPLKKGWVLICVDGMALGWAKYAGGVLKNKYYPGWRMQ